MYEQTMAQLIPMNRRAETSPAGDGLIAKWASSSIPAITWRIQAQRIVAYPEDFGLNRQQVRGLQRTLAERHQQMGQ